MKIAKRFLKAAAAIAKNSDEQGRFSLRSAKIDANGWIVASDGRVLIASKIAEKDEVLVGAIQPLRLPTVAQDATVTRGEGVDLLVHQKFKGKDVNTVAQDEPFFPKWKEFFPGEPELPGLPVDVTGSKKYVFAALFDPEVLRRALEMFDEGVGYGEGEGNGVEMWVAKESGDLNPVLLTHGKSGGNLACAVVMPARSTRAK